ncbi:MAG TPA: WHG domain-containing protein, partial [Thermomonospora sp.]|nr:WHG domain-containing protein [Thermomonospora sp.]
AALAAFDVLASAVAAAAAAGRVGDEPPRALAGQVWSAMHGYVLLEIAGFTGPETQSQVLAPMMAKILNAPELSPGEPT